MNTDWIALLEAEDSAPKATEPAPMVVGSAWQALREGIEQATLVQQLDPLMEQALAEYQQGRFTQQQAEGLALRAKERARIIEDPLSGPAPGFYIKALQAHQQGWNKLYWLGQTTEIKQEIGRISLHPGAAYYKVKARK